MEIPTFALFLAVVNAAKTIIVSSTSSINEFFALFGCGVVKVTGHVSFTRSTIRKEVACCSVKKYSQLLPLRQSKFKFVRL